jgi:hypothetical protein
MGDPLTKLLLSWSQQFVFNKIWRGIPRVGSHVGDDLIIVSPYKDKLIEHIHQLSRLGFKISIKDTVLSRRYIFFCEQLGEVP